MQQNKSDRLGTVVKIIAILTFLFGGGIFWRVWDSRENSPTFSYTYEGAFDQHKPEYEVASPLSWAEAPPSLARILVRADYKGKKYSGVVYVKIQQANGKVVTATQWDDFNTQAGTQKAIPLTFEQLFDYAGLARYALSLDVSMADTVDFMKPIRGEFKIYAEQSGQVITGSESTVTVINTGWYHRTYLDHSDSFPGDKIRAFVEVANFGAESDFSITTCAYEVATLSYQMDPTKITNRIDEKGWWPDREGNLKRRCETYESTRLHLKRGEFKTIAIDLLPAYTSAQGFYAYGTFVIKNLPAVDYGAEDWATSTYVRDNRQYTAYFVVGQ